MGALKLHYCESGLSCERADHYNPELGRFISEDPIDFKSGDFNLRRYVGNNPTNNKDPKGESIFLGGACEVAVAIETAGSFAVLELISDQIDDVNREIRRLRAIQAKDKTCSKRKQDISKLIRGLRKVRSKLLREQAAGNADLGLKALAFQAICAGLLALPTL